MVWSVQFLFGSIEVSNVQDRTIKYTEWLLECLDILKRPIASEYPVYVRHEAVLAAGKTTVASTEGDLPSRAKSFISKLIVVLFEDSQIVEFDTAMQTRAVGPRNPIEGLGGFDPEFLVSYQEEHSFVEGSMCFYEVHAQEICTCAFCCTSNRSDSIACRLCGESLTHLM